MVNMYQSIEVDEYKTQFKDGAKPHLLLDVRTVEEYEEVRIQGAVLIPLDELSERLDEVANLAGEQPVVMVCRSGVRSAMGAQVLRYGGFTGMIYNLEGGTKAWVGAHGEVESGEAF